MTEPLDEDTSRLRHTVTQVLGELSQGDPEADARLLQLVYDELRRLAGRKMEAQDPAHTLQPTALVNEVYLRLLGRGTGGAPSYNDRRHFFAAAATAMRSILVDHARRKRADKRGGDRARVTLRPELAAEELSERVLQVHELLDLFAEGYPRQARVAELLFFAGLSVPEAAGLLEVSDRTVKRDWRFGRAWLTSRIQEDEG